MLQIFLILDVRYLQMWLYDKVVFLVIYSLYFDAVKVLKSLEYIME